jgi:hypothetical protein
MIKAIVNKSMVVRETTTQVAGVGNQFHEIMIGATIVIMTIISITSIQMATAAATTIIAVDLLIRPFHSSRTYHQPPPRTEHSNPLCCSYAAFQALAKAPWPIASSRANPGCTCGSIKTLSAIGMYAKTWLDQPLPMANVPSSIGAISTPCNDHPF